MAYGHERLGDPGRDARSGSGTDMPTSGSPPTSRRRSKPRCGSAEPRLRGRGSRRPRRTGASEAVPEVRAVYAWVAARPVETMPAAELAETWDEVWSADRTLLVDPLLRHPRAVPGARGPRRPVRVGHRGAGTGRGPGTDRRRRSTSCRTSSADSRSWRRWWPRTPGLAERLAEPGVTVDDLAAVPGRRAIRACARARSSPSTAISARPSTT